MNKSSAYLSRKEREHQARRHYILQAAEKLFAQRGFYGTTMADLATGSEFSVGTLYNFFKSKEEVYYSLIMEKLDSMLQQLTGEINNLPEGLPQIKGVITGVFKFFQENKDFFRIFFAERFHLVTSVGPTAVGELRRKYLAYLRFVTKIMARAIKQKEVQPVEPQKLAYFLVGIMNAFIFHWTVYAQKSELISEIPFIYKLFLEGAGKKRSKQDDV
ncbi:MAG: TetR/AcrR family transcriptional regulator [Thermodesulfobacteriota bacterium]